MKGKVIGVSILGFMLVIGIFLLLFSFFVLWLDPNLLPNHLHLFFIGGGLLLTGFVLQIFVPTFIKTGSWQKTRKNPFIVVVLSVMLAAGLVLIFYGAYYLQVGLQRGFAPFIFGMVFLNIFSSVFLYILWKNWYEWERKILKVLVPYQLVWVIVIVILIVLSILKMI